MVLRYGELIPLVAK